MVKKTLASESLGNQRAVVQRKNIFVLTTNFRFYFEIVPKSKDMKYNFLVKYVSNKHSL